MRNLVSDVLRRSTVLWDSGRHAAVLSTIRYDSSKASTPGARVDFRSGNGTTRPKDSADMAKGLGVEVEEMDCDVDGLKRLKFSGRGATPPATSSPEQAEHANGHAQLSPGAMPHSAQDKYRTDRAAMRAAAQRQRSCALSERLNESKYTEGTSDKIEAAAEKPPPRPGPQEEERVVSRYQAMKAAAASAFQRMRVSSEGQPWEGSAAGQAAEGMYARAMEALHLGAQAVRDFAGGGGTAADQGTAQQRTGPPSSPERPPRTVNISAGRVSVRPSGGEGEEVGTRAESSSSPDSVGAWPHGGSTYNVHPGGGGATKESQEERAHRSERDASSY